jgi:hypothetical protein
MTWLWEEPVYIAILGGVTVAFLAFGFMQTRSRALLTATLVAAALTGVLLLVERWVETERERIDATLRRIALDVERNDLDAILSHVYSEADWTRDQARAEFPKYEFTRVDIKRNLEVEVDDSVQPPRAVATFNVRVDLVELSTRISFQHPAVRATHSPQGKRRLESRRLRTLRTPAVDHDRRRDR